jgi:pimeloyl-ACP methyl ester carboxylesterase
MEETKSVFRSAQAKAAFDRAYDDVLALWPVPYEELFVPTRFDRTHVIASGPRDALSLVLFHPSGCGAVIWHRSVGELSRRFRTYAVDTMGEMNRSVPTRRIRGRTELMEWIDDLFGGLAIDKADLVGNSFGGYLSLSTALQFPEKVNRIVLISPAATFDRMWPWMLHFFPAYLTQSRHLLARAYEWIWQDLPVEPGIKRLREMTSLSGLPWHTGPAVFRDDELRRIRAPVLLLIGDHEVIYKREKVFRKARRLVPDIKAQTVPDANHNAEYTAAEAVNRAILGFLS